MNTEQFVDYYTEKVTRLAEKYNLRSQIWIQGFGPPAEEIEDVRTAAETTVAGEVDSVFNWGWDDGRSVLEQPS